MDSETWRLTRSMSKKRKFHKLSGLAPPGLQKSNASPQAQEQKRKRVCTRKTAPGSGKLVHQRNAVRGLLKTEALSPGWTTSADEDDRARDIDWLPGKETSRIGSGAVEGLRPAAKTARGKRADRENVKALPARGGMNANDGRGGYNPMPKKQESINGRKVVKIGKRVTRLSQRVAGKRPMSSAPLGKGKPIKKRNHESSDHREGITKQDCSENADGCMEALSSAKEGSRSGSNSADEDKTVGEASLVPLGAGPEPSSCANNDPRPGDLCARTLRSSTRMPPRRGVGAGLRTDRNGVSVVEQGRRAGRSTDLCKLQESRGEEESRERIALAAAENEEVSIVLKKVSPVHVSTTSEILYEEGKQKRAHACTPEKPSADGSTSCQKASSNTGEMSETGADVLTEGSCDGEDDTASDADWLASEADEENRPCTGDESPPNNVRARQQQRSGRSLEGGLAGDSFSIQRSWSYPWRARQLCSCRWAAGDFVRTGAGAPTNSMGTPVMEFAWYGMTHYYGGRKDDFSSERRDWTLLIAIAENVPGAVKGLPSKLQKAFLDAFHNEVTMLKVHLLMDLDAVSWHESTNMDGPVGLHVAAMRALYVRVADDGGLEVFNDPGNGPFLKGAITTPLDETLEGVIGEFTKEYESLDLTTIMTVDDVTRRAIAHRDANRGLAVPTPTQMRIQAVVQTVDPEKVIPRLRKGELARSKRATEDAPAEQRASYTVYDESTTPRRPVLQVGDPSREAVWAANAASRDNCKYYRVSWEAAKRRARMRAGYWPGTKKVVGKNFWPKEWGGKEMLVGAVWADAIVDIRWEKNDWDESTKGLNFPGGIPPANVLLAYGMTEEEAQAQRTAAQAWYEAELAARGH